MFPYCFGFADGDVAVAQFGGNGGNTYAWTNTSNLTNSPSGLADNTYTVTVTDAKGCTATGEQPIAAPSELMVNVSGTTDPLCNGDCNGDITVTVP